MKKRIFFIVLAIVQIIAAIYMIATADSVVQATIDVYRQTQEIVSTDMMQEMIQMLEEKGVASIRVCSGLCILVNIGILITAIKNTILRNKGLMIAATVISILFGGDNFAILLAVIGLIILLVSKRTNPEDFPVKKEIPVLEKIKMNKRELIIGISLVLVYFSQYIWGPYIPENPILNWGIQIAFYLAVLIISIMFWKKSIKRDLKTFKENFGTYIRFILPKLALMYLIYFVVNMGVIIMTGSITSANQEGLEAMPTWYVVPLALLYAPIVEETIFRGLIHKVVKNKYLFIIVSAICFGLLHTVAVEVTLLNVIVKALPYAVLGAFLAYVYDRTDNITTNMFSHFIINLLASLITLM